jgi:hypothetical protein
MKTDMRRRLARQPFEEEISDPLCRLPLQPREAKPFTRKTIPRFLMVSLILLAMVSAQQALAGDCASGRCPFTSVAPSVPSAPATTASASRGFTATGGTRVADVNLSQEGLARLAAGDKEEPLPKGFSTAADRAKLAAKPLKPRKSFAHVVMTKPREAKPFYAARRSVARTAKPRKSFAHVVEL